MMDCVGAKRHFAGRFFSIEAHSRFEPLPIPVHQADQRNGGVTNLRGETGQVIVGLLGQGIENLISV